MKKLVTSVSIVTLILMIGLAVNMAFESPASAQEETTQTSEDQPNEDAANTTAENYEYVAQPGDSYIQMARKAVQTYGFEANGQIGAAGILFAETNLASLAGWPELNEGQAVTISKESVKEWFDKAAKLSADEKAAWEIYVPHVDFNTNNVGE